MQSLYLVESQKTVLFTFRPLATVNSIRISDLLFFIAPTIGASSEEVFVQTLDF